MSRLDIGERHDLEPGNDGLLVLLIRVELGDCDSARLRMPTDADVGVG
jgi:hypothetical protein